MDNYKKLIKVTTTKDGEVILTMPKHIHTRLMNNLFDGYMRQDEHDLKATADDTRAMWKAVDIDDGEDDDFSEYENFYQECGERKGDNAIPSYETWKKDPKYWSAWMRDEVE